MRLILCFFALVVLANSVAAAAPLTGSWEARSLLMATGSIPLKVSDTQLCLDATLDLSTAFSGLSLHSRTSFSFVGPETQFITASGTLGPLSLSDTLIFSRNIIEADSSGQIKASSPDPGGLVGSYLPFFSYYDSVTALVDLCRRLGPTLEGQPVIFRKKIAEVSLNVAGLKLASTFLFANLGSSGVPSFRVGATLSVSGQTVSGIQFESFTYIGMRNQDGYEFECFGQCHEDERFSQGRVVPGFAFELERLNLNKLILAGVNFDIAALFNFNAAEGPVGFEKMTITSSAEIKPLSLSITDILALDNSLNLSSHTLITSLRFSDAYATLILTDIADPTNDVGFEFQTFVISFTLGNWSITSNIYTCADNDADCAFLNAVYQHDLTLSYTKDILNVTALLEFYGLISSFNKFVISANVKIKEVTLHAATAVQTKQLTAQEFSVKIVF
ncbi:hypothetical protein HYR54_00040 [Candidatus Acetothermia bacterium]|nr:hypothetical protein [Candidatus Acetothermia bacterium]